MTNIINEQFTRCMNILNAKNNEYSNGIDRLSFFKTGAEKLNISPEEMLVNCMSKHFISIILMSKRPTDFDNTIWDEKITDSINYLLLLKGLLNEQNRN